jgi:hypothetical protein
MRESIGAMNYVLGSGGTMRGWHIGVYDALSRRYSPVHNGTMALVWPGNVLTTPADMAASPTAPGFDTKWILVGAGVSAVVVVAGVTLLVRKRHAHLQAIMLQLFTEVSPVSPVSPHRFLQRPPLSSPSAQPPVRFVHSSRGHRYHRLDVT